MLITIRAVTPFDSIRRTVLFSYIDRESITGAVKLDGATAKLRDGGNA